MKARGRNNRNRNRPPAPGGGVYSLLWPIRGSSARSGSFFRLQVYQRVGITLVKVYERVGKSVISVLRRPKRAVKMSRKRAGLGFIHVLNTVSLQQFKGMQTVCERDTICQ